MPIAIILMIFIFYNIKTYNNPQVVKWSNIKYWDGTYEGLL